MLEINRSTLYRWQRAGRIQPVYGRRVTPQAGFSLYRREDLRRLVTGSRNDFHAGHRRGRFHRR